MENNSEILSKIKSGDSTLIAEAIKDVQENGDFSIAETLLNSLPTIEEQHTITIICNLLADIKESKFRELLISKLQETKDKRIKCELLRIVWESALDYTSYLEFFLDLLNDDDFTVAFEASTIIENIDHNLNKEQHAILDDFLRNFPKDKQFLIENIIEEINSEEHFEDDEDDENKKE